MTSPSGLEYGIYYHIFNRGVNRENVFRDEKNYDYFVNLYIKHVSPIADTFAYCLLRNHFHLLVRIKSREEIKETLKVLAKHPEGAETFRVSQRFSNFFNAYAKSINKAYGRTGSLFQHPFGRIVIHTDAYFLRAIRYIHRNPQKHGFVADFRDWPYSSYKVMFETSPSFVKRDEILKWFGDVNGYEKFHRENLDEAVPFAPDDDERYQIA